MRKKQFKEESITLGIRVPKSKKDILKKKFNKIVSKYKNKKVEIETNDKINAYYESLKLAK